MFVFVRPESESGLAPHLYLMRRLTPHDIPTSLAPQSLRETPPSSPL